MILRFGQYRGCAVRDVDTPYLLWLLGRQLGEGLRIAVANEIWRRAKQGDPLVGVDHDFEAVWDAYPKKANKATTREAFHRASALYGGPAVVRQRVVEALTWQTREWTDEQFIPSLRNYLDGARWMDEPAMIANSGVSRAG